MTSKIKKLSKRLISIMLCLVMLATIFFVFDPMVLKAEATISDTTPSYKDIAFYAPEAIYLAPQVKSSKEATTASFQWYVQNTVNTSSIYTQPTPNANRATTGKIYFASQSASNASLSYKFINSSGNVLNGSITHGSLSNSGHTAYYSADITGGTSPGLAANDTGCYIQWTVSYTDSTDGLVKKAIAYTYVYKPYTVPVIAATAMFAKDYLSSGQMTWISGIHNISNNGNVTVATGDLGSSKISTYNTFADDRDAVKNYGSSFFLSNANSGTTMSLAFPSYCFVPNWSNKQRANPEHYLVRNGSVASCETYNIQNVDFYWNTDSGNRNDGALFFRAQVQGNMYIDTSRYTNLSQIPNLGVGLLATETDCHRWNMDVKDWANGGWRIADSSGKRNNAGGFFSNNETHTRMAWGGNWDNIVTFTNASTYNYAIAQAGDPNNQSGGYGGTGLKYGGVWNRSIISGSTTRYSIRGEYFPRTGTVSYTQAVIDLVATQSNKATLRTAVFNASKLMAKYGIKDDSFNSYFYEGSEWSIFVSAYKAACFELTKVDGAVTSSAVTTLNNAVSALNNVTKKTGIAYLYHYLCQHNGSGWTFTTTSIAPTESKTFSYGQNVTFTKASTSFATYLGYSLSNTDNTIDGTDASKTVNISSTPYNMYFYYKPITYTITLDNRSATTAGTTEIYEAYMDGVYLNNTDYPLMVTGENKINLPTKIGYVFGGYYTAPNGGGTQLITPTGFISRYFINTYFTSNTTLYAKWTPITYFVAYNGNGNTDGTMARSYHTYDVASDLTANAYTKTGYNFAGWSTSANGAVVFANGASVYNLASTQDDVVTLFAKWTTQLYTIDYDLNGGVATNKTTYNVTTATFTLNNPVKKGYTFTGWTGTNGTTPETTVAISKGSTGNRSYTANFTPTQYTISYALNGGTATNPTSYNVETEGFTLLAPVKSNSVFEGWKIVSADSETGLNVGRVVYNLTFGNGMVGNISLEAQWHTHSFVNGVCDCSAVLYSLKNGAFIDNGFIFGLTANMTRESFADYLSIADGYTLDVIGTQNGYGTGTVLKINNNHNETVCTLNAVILGDVNGDSWYDGTDAVIVACIVNGILRFEQIPDTVWLAADCNFDGLIDDIDVQLLEQAGLLLASVDQTMSAQELALTSAYQEYINMIDQNPYTQETEDSAPTEPNQSIFSKIISYIFNIFKWLLKLFK